MRPRLSIHNMVKEPKEGKKFNNWLKYKFGQAPVLFDEEICFKLNNTFDNRLYHKGYFNAHSTHKILEKKKSVQIKYFIQPKRVYTIDTIIFPESNDPLELAINKFKSETLIKKGMPYDLETIKKERERIDQNLKDMGYYYFDPDHLLFKADTTQKNLHVKLKLLVKNDIPKKSPEVFKIDKVYITEDFLLKSYAQDTSQYENYKMVSTQRYVKPKLILNHVFLEQDNLYSNKDHYNTIRQLMEIGAYKYVNVKYSESPDKKNYLDARLTLTPSQKMAASAELNAVSKSNNFTGPDLKLTFQSRNFLKGAEVFSINFNGHVEKQFTSNSDGDLAYEFSVDASITIPRNIPFKSKKVSKPYTPFTNITIGTGIYTRSSMYKFNSFNAGLEYSWRKNKNLMHKFKPIDISLTNLIDATDEFNEFLLQNPSIYKSFEEQFIIGGSYNFIYNHLYDPKKPQYYISFGIDPSGNLMGLVSGLLSNTSNTPENPATLFGLPVSQYLKLRIDTRYYFKTGAQSKIATRLYGGIGLPYGSSNIMPYVKQFYAGGTNGIRAFSSRSLGPGTYHPADSLSNMQIDQTGEIKIEFNAEYRFPISKYLKGALFTDLGNVWLVHEDTLRPGSKFNFDSFYKEIAVGVGTGLRLDLDLIVLRLDWAFPLTKPWLPEGERWVFNEIDLFDSKWRRDNILWNISIGYPF
ncbi:MAG: BamA/TamA family outer membrane protein [Bacteroidales bacterium]|nr:BamA/TamA family outer membrane protein [Bacteroidales bacterium]